MIINAKNKNILIDNRLEERNPGDLNGKPILGEMTFTPAGGMDHWTPPEWDLKLGNLLKLPEKED